MEIYFQRAFFGNKTKIMVIYVHFKKNSSTSFNLIPWSTNALVCGHYTIDKNNAELRGTANIQKSLFLCAKL